MMRLLAGLALALVLAGPAARAAPVETGHLAAELVAERQGIAPGETLQLALRQKIRKGWHTYWRNPGDAGEATRLRWTLPAGWTAGPIVWPAPRRFVTRSGAVALMNYVYEDEVLLPVAVTAPAGARPGETAVLQAAAAFLVCAEICVPEDAALTLTLPVTATPPPPDHRWSAAIAKAVAEAPRPAGLQAAFTHEAGHVVLAVAGAPLAGVDLGRAYFFPFKGAVIDQTAPQAIERGPQGLTLTIAAGYDFRGGQAPEVLAGVLSLGARAYEIEARAGPPPAGAAGLGPVAAEPQAGEDAAATPAGPGLGLAAAALLALAGGIVLNLMPCVFPILAMKAASLAGHAHERAAARAQGLAFLGGVLAAFLALAGLMIALRAGGAAVGWGFQLQAPPVVAGLALLMLAVALNLSGLFEVGASLQGVGGRAAGRGGIAGAAATGALAVLVAAPCTAPFMAPALGWALTQSPPAALAVFAALGLGFGLPFAAAAFVPDLLSHLPKPGPWMQGFKRLMAFPMYGTAAWLAWVLSIQAGPAGLGRLLAAGVAFAFAAWLLGIAQRRRAAGGRPVLTAGLGVVVALAAAAGVVWPGYGAGPAAAQAEGRVPSEPYSAGRLAAAQAEGRPVLVNFTAAWCVTCQVNERAALSSPRVARAFARANALYLKGDWTRRDAGIAAELARHGRAGVPLYLVYGAKGGEPAVLPQILTEGTVEAALARASGR
ncbi:protein-disulfide reductase DsbD family protein [Phenylobacterium sp.]|jgi:thiol:disulfide interchange protein DsbD|uniref:protein-disulfide reductase DsbD family protein n=1 Tax=Phenylobacterium sp. TaxID=1871053 RepID=UPI002F3E6F40